VKSCGVRRGAIALALATASAAKLFAPNDRSLVSGWFGTLTDPALLVTFAILEACLALVILTRQWRAALWLVASLMTGFIVFLDVALAQGISPASCGCFGRLRVAPETHFAFLFGIVLLALSCLFEAKSRDRALV
jgi:hypothetical protein